MGEATLSSPAKRVSPVNFAAKKVRYPPLRSEFMYPLHIIITMMVDNQ
jgi:hypothetical protein